MPQLNRKRTNLYSAAPSAIQNDNFSSRNSTDATSKDTSQQLSSGMESSLDRKTPHNFDYWFTWCQLCRHGGHAAHLRDWFRTHVECPVSDCECRCRQLDH
jgi:hypothetical protein